MKLVISIANEQPVMIREEEMVPIALIINELFTNAIKHSAVKSGKVVFSLDTGDQSATVKVRNNLSESGEAISASESATGVGMHMVKALMPPSGAELNAHRKEAEFVVELSLSPPVVYRAQGVDRQPNLDFIKV